MFYFRRAVPPDARHFFDKGEVVISLKTRDLAEARHLLNAELRNFEAKLAKCRGHVAPAERVRRDTYTPTKTDIEMVVRKWLVDRDQRMDARGSTDHFDDADEVEQALAKRTSALEHLTKNASTAQDAHWVAEQLAEQNGWSIHPSSALFRRMTQMIVRGQIESNERQRQELAGEPVRTLDQRFGPDEYQLDKDRELPKIGPSLVGLLEEYLKERKPKRRTVKAYRLHLQPFCDFVGHDDAARVTAKDVINWKVELQSRKSKIGQPLSPNTINGNYLRVLRIVLGFAVENLHIQSNPALGIKVRTAANAPPPRRGLTDEEALIILRGTLEEAGARFTKQGKRARRWVPWICAFTGSRVNEITQARAEDIKEINGIWSIRITPEAGTVKNDQERIVALHPQILDQGFLEAIDGLEGPLFYDPANSRSGNAANAQYEKAGQRLGEWVRGLGIIDTRVDPSHGWRHRFKTVARRWELDPETRDYIQGHKPRTEGEGYGEIEPEVTLREIKKLPRYEID